MENFNKKFKDFDKNKICNNFIMNLANIKPSR